MGMMFARRRADEKKAMRDKEAVAEKHNKARHQKAAPKEVESPPKEAAQDGADKPRKKQDSPAPRVRG